MIVELKQSIPYYTIQSIPEVTFHGQWLCDKITSKIENLGNT